MAQTDKPGWPADVSIGDAVRALDLALRGVAPEERASRLREALEWLPEMLHFDLPAPPRRKEKKEPADDQPKPPAEASLPLPQTDRPSARADEDSSPAPEADPVPTKPAGPTLPYRLLTVGNQRAQRSWLDENAPLAPAKKFSLSDRPPLDPLFDPLRSRSVLSGALSTAQPEGDIDFDAILHKVTSCQPIGVLPRHPAATTRLGLQLLIDYGRAMLPFARDQSILLRDILNVIGKDRVEQLRFADAPLRGNGPGTRDTWKPQYRPPPPGTPVVVVSELGLARAKDVTLGASVEEWLLFAEQVREADCPLLALVPYRPERCPMAIRRAFRVLAWDRGTSVATVRKLIGRGLSAG